LTFWYKMVCNDTLTYDWAIATVTNTSGTVLTTPLGKTCTNSGAWVQVTSNLSSWAGQTVVIKLANHDDNNPGDASYTLFDDVAVSGGSAPPPDFSLALGSSTVTSTGGVATTSATVTPSNSFTGTVSLAVTAGMPSGASSTFSPTSVSGGSGASTLSLTPGSAAAGSYALTVTATSGSLTHSAALTWVIGAAGSTLANGGFEAGSLSGWTAAGVTSVVSSGAHGGTYAAQLGDSSPSTDSSISQQVTLPAGSPSLTFWYKVTCPDSVTYDWATVTVSSSSGTLLTTPLAKTCVTAGAWTQVTTDLTTWAGQTVVLKFANHDDNYAGDPTFTQFDDIAISP
jgi:hypothetical protein